MKITPWFQRKFSRIDDDGLLPAIIERLAGTPLRLRLKLNPVESQQLILKREGKWSVQEEAGHLLDLEPLWYGRVFDLINGAKVLRDADLENTKTEQAGHNQTPLNDLLAAFGRDRARLLNIVGEAGLDHMQATALHPRLRTPMRVIDLAYFVAEHDDHHLATISKLLYESQH